MACYWLKPVGVPFYAQSSIIIIQMMFILPWSGRKLSVFLFVGQLSIGSISAILPLGLNNELLMCLLASQLSFVSILLMQRALLFIVMIWSISLVLPLAFGVKLFPSGVPIGNCVNNTTHLYLALILNKTIGVPFGVPFVLCIFITNKTFGFE